MTKKCSPDDLDELEELVNKIRSVLNDSGVEEYKKMAALALVVGNSLKSSGEILEFTQCLSKFWNVRQKMGFSQ